MRPYSDVTVSPNIEYTSLSEKEKLVGTNCDWIKDNNYPTISFCEAGDINSKNIINVMGDSHAQALFPSLDDFGKNNAIKFRRFKIPGCSHFIDNVTKGNGSKVSNCSHEFDNLAELLKRERNDLIITYRWMFRLYPIDGYQLDMPTKNNAGAEEKESYREHFIFLDGDYLSTEVAKAESLKRFLEKLTSSSRRTFILSSVPEVSYDIERVNRDYYIKSGRSEVLSELSIGYDEYLTRNSFLNKFFSNFEFSNATLISVENVFCNSFIEGRCVAQYQGIPFYYDDDHLSKVGADLVVELIMEQIKKAEITIRKN